MAFRADLEIDGKEYRLLHCSYALSRSVDATGRPSSEVKPMTLQFTLSAKELKLGSETHENDWPI